jgi:dolichol-phosphate mannosyltransferase
LEEVVIVTTKKRINVVIPAYNEEDCVEELARRLAAIYDQESDYDFETIIIENGSTDSTWEKLEFIANEDARFKVIKLSRNFRMDGGLTAGLSYCTGDAVVLMTADLQDPPELISIFLRKWEDGFENVYGIITKREGTGPIRRFNSEAFYWLAGKLTDNRIPRNASDFRLLDRRAYEAIRSMDERNRFVRGLAAWVGFKSVGIEMERPPRFGGVSNAHTLGVLDLAFKGIFAHSYLPLRIITLTGATVFALSLVTLVVLVGKWVIYGVPFSGYGTLVTITLATFGLLALMLGIVSEYVGLIYEEVKRRPNYIVSKTVGLDYIPIDRDRSGNE